MREHLVKFEKGAVDAGGLVTVARAAQLIGFSRRTLYDWIAAGKLAGVVVRCDLTGSVRLKASAFLDWVDAHFTQVRPPKLAG
jgi:excisionase family DNA binding protein